MNKSDKANTNISFLVFIFFITKIIPKMFIYYKS